MATVYISAGRRRRNRAIALTYVAIISGVIALVAHALSSSGRAAGRGGPQLTSTALAWPNSGQAAFAVDGGHITASGDTRPVAIASLAKVMTALVVLRSHPLGAGDAGFTVSITPEDVDDTARRRADGQSVVAVVAGERLTERQALEALLLPSANNIAMVLARAVAGTSLGFVDRMNQQARRLGMTATTYTDPSGLDEQTRSTARDQVVLARAAMKLAAFAAIVRLHGATLPVAGVVTNTDSLLGRDGFLGVKTGSDQAAGGCFLFATRYTKGTRTIDVYGAVLGQRNGPFIPAGLRAAKQLADSIRAALEANGIMPS